MTDQDKLALEFASHEADAGTTFLLVETEFDAFAPRVLGAFTNYTLATDQIDNPNQYVIEVKVNERIY